MLLYYIITVCVVWQNNLCLSGTLLTGCTSLVQVSTAAFIRHGWKMLKIWSNLSCKVLISLQGFSWNSKSFNKLLPNSPAPNLSQIGKGTGDAENGWKFIYATVHSTVSTELIFMTPQFPSILLYTYPTLNCRQINKKCKAWWAKKAFMPWREALHPHRQNSQNSLSFNKLLWRCSSSKFGQVEWKVQKIWLKIHLHL